MNSVFLFHFAKICNLYCSRFQRCVSMILKWSDISLGFSRENLSFRIHNLFSAGISILKHELINKTRGILLFIASFFWDFAFCTWSPLTKWFGLCWCLLLPLIRSCSYDIGKQPINQPFEPLIRLSHCMFWLFRILKSVLWLRKTQKLCSSCFQRSLCGSKIQISTV